MRDKWMNIGYEDDELKPFIEPEADFNDPVRIGNRTVYADMCESGLVGSFSLCLITPV